LYWLPIADTYAGLWASGVDFEDQGDTSWELTAYAGRTFALGSTLLGFQIGGTMYPNKTAPGDSYDFLKATLEVSQSFGQVTTTWIGNWTPDAAASTRKAGLLRGEVEYAVFPWLSFVGGAGRRWAEAGTDRTYWDGGLSVSASRFTLDVGYADTNLDRSECFYLDWCEPTVLATLTTDLWR
jgi:uncharacterized protein (TIGR02001 family)